MEAASSISATRADGTSVFSLEPVVREEAAAVLAIDPGASGGFAWRSTDGDIHAEPMPKGMTDQLDRLRDLVAEYQIDKCVIEKVGFHVQGNHASASAKFARHVGHMECCLYMLGVPTEQVSPGTWQRHLGKLPKDKPVRKRAIKEWAKRLHPAQKVTLKTADAFGMLDWYETRAR